MRVSLNRQISQASIIKSFGAAEISSSKKDTYGGWRAHIIIHVDAGDDGLHTFIYHNCRDSTKSLPK